jgi:hypothetical protein
MGEVVDLPGHSKIPDENDHEFISDLARFADNLLSEAAVKKKYRLAESAWEALGSNDELVEKIEAEKIRRTRDGSTKREKAQQLITKAPGILDSIMTDPATSPRHRVDAIKTLDGFASNGPESAPAADRFQITINLGSDVLHFDKSIAIDANDVDPFNDTDTTPPGLLAAIAANKRKDDGGGEPL